MLDLSAVKRQIDLMVADRTGRDAGEQFRQSRQTALEELDRWSGGDRHEELAAKVRASRTSWLLAGIGESPGAVHPLPSRPPRISVSATDGSQIFPDGHEISSCFLINIGYVLLHYGSGERPLLNSKPQLFSGEEDLFKQEGLLAAWEDRQVGVNREFIGFRRSLLELTELAELSAASVEEGHPTMALADGTLIFWNLEGMPVNFRNSYLDRAKAAFDLLRAKGVPIASYISRPRSRDLINSLRVGMCPLEAADCDHCPWKGGELPCSPPARLVDATLMRSVLQAGERSAMFSSRSKILEQYGDHRISFFYLHAGDEMARVEVPHWVAADKEMVDTVHAVVEDQIRKGDGYPVSLTEAHEQAVVRGAERESFYRFLRDTFIMNDIDASFSAKSLKKRMPAV
jgi:hypothetical protein